MLHGLYGFCSGMATTDKLQQMVLEGLDTHAEAVDAHSSPCLRLLQSDISRVGLDGDLVRTRVGACAEDGLEDAI